MPTVKTAFASDGTMAMDKKRKTVLNNRGFYDRIDLCYEVPRKYYNYEHRNRISPLDDGRFVAIEGDLKRVYTEPDKYGHTIVKAILTTEGKKGDLEEVQVSYFGAPFMGKSLEPLQGQRCLVVGDLKILYGKYFIANPVIFDALRLVKLKWYTVYAKNRGISEDVKRALIEQALKEEPLPETIPEKYRMQYHILERKQALIYLHYPKSAEQIKAAVFRNIIEDMLYFACSKERLIQRNNQNKSCYPVITAELVKTAVSSLSYDLTKDQKKVLQQTIGDMMAGKRVNALIQGDVGCGKSIVIFLLMIAMAENGHQSVIMAPTVVLAKQHYNDLTALAKPLGLKTVFIGGGTGAGKKADLEAVGNGSCKLIVGTHAVASENVSYPSLGLLVIDEEHRFGVQVREKLLKTGCHSINFTATPIPRTLTQVLFAERDLHEIKTMPKGRRPVITRVIDNKYAAMETVKQEITKGNQAYVVCPLIESDADDSNVLSSVTNVAREYGDYLKTEIGIVTGKQKQKETAEILSRFKAGQIRVLCATTVIEVGVNVPNATCIVIEDAYRFGLAQLHQLRGRVGRSDKQGYCILRSDRDSERLAVMEKTSNGFEIAERDYELRGGGDLFGEDQSGNNRYLRTISRYPKYFSCITKTAKEMVQNHEEESLIREMERRSDKIYVDMRKIQLKKT